MDAFWGVLSTKLLHSTEIISFCNKDLPFVPRKPLFASKKRVSLLQNAAPCYKMATIRASLVQILSLPLKLLRFATRTPLFVPSICLRLLRSLRLMLVTNGASLLQNARISALSNNYFAQSAVLYQARLFFKPTATSCLRLKKRRPCYKSASHSHFHHSTEIISHRRAICTKQAAFCKQNDGVLVTKCPSGSLTHTLLTHSHDIALQNHTLILFHTQIIAHPKYKTHFLSTNRL